MAAIELVTGKPGAPEKEPIDPRDNRVIYAPTVRTFTDWTPQRLRTAELMAEQGNLYWAVTLCEWLLTDDRVSGALGARVEALLGLEPSFELGVGRRAKRAQKALEAGEDWWEAYPESQLSQIVKWGILLGIAPARHNWTERKDHAGRLLPMPTFWHPQTLRFDTWSRTWRLQEYGGAEIVVKPGDGEWILHAPYGLERAWSNGLWRYLGRWALIKAFAMTDWARHSEKGAMQVVTAPELATKDQRREIAEDIANAGTDRTISLPNGFDMKLLEITANTANIYKAQIDMADLAFAVAIRGGNLSTVVQEGSRAAAQSQAKTGDQAKLRFDAQALTTTLHDQSLTWWAEFNFGDKRLAPWPVYPVEPEDDKAARAGMLNTLGDGLAKLRDVGLAFDPLAVKEEFALDFVVVADPGKPGASGKQPELAPPEQPDGGKAAKASASKRTARLASGAAADSNSGFVNGQEYVDRVVVDSTEVAGKSFEGSLLGDLLDAIDGADSYDAIRAAVLTWYGEAAAPDELREALRKAFVLADLAGAAAVVEDSQGD